MEASRGPAVRQPGESIPGVWSEKGGAQMRKKVPVGKIALGAALLICGAGFLGDIFNLWDFNLSGGWWTLFLIVPGVVLLVRDGMNTGSMVLIGIGLWQLLIAQDVISYGESIKVLLAIFLIGAGLVVIFGRKKHRIEAEPAADPYRKQEPGPSPHAQEPKRPRPDPGVKKNSDFNDFPAYTAVFWGGEHKNCCQDLKGGKADAVFGGIDIDFSDAVITRDIVFEANAVFGGIDIVAPKNCRVIVETTNVFGGSENKRMAGYAYSESMPAFIVKGSAVFGGIEVC